MNDLSQLQIQLLQDYADGKKITDVPDDTDKKHNALTNHLWHARQKMGARTTAHAVAMALRAGLIR